jgi:hypothetical protein
MHDLHKLSQWRISQPRLKMNDERRVFPVGSVIENRVAISEIIRRAW